MLDINLCHVSQLGVNFVEVRECCNYSRMQKRYMTAVSVNRYRLSVLIEDLGCVVRSPADRFLKVSAVGFVDNGIRDEKCSFLDLERLWYLLLFQCMLKCGWTLGFQAQFSSEIVEKLATGVAVATFCENESLSMLHSLLGLWICATLHLDWCELPVGLG